jgi:hypothetical protein
VLNPGDSAAGISVTYFLGDGTTRMQSFDLGPGSRGTVSVKQFLGEGNDSSHDFSCRVECLGSGGIVVERPQYFEYLMPL